MNNSTPKTKVNPRMLTTVDNPYNPFTHWSEWYAWDNAHGYSTTQRFARKTFLSDAFRESIGAAMEEFARRDPFEVTIVVDERSCELLLAS